MSAYRTRPRYRWTPVAVVLVVALTLGVAWREGPVALLAILQTQPRLILNTLVFGVAAAALGTALGWAIAHVQTLHAFRGRRVLHLVTLAPLMMPSFTFALALVVLLGHNGLLVPLGWSGEVYGLAGLTAAATFSRLPFAYLILLVAYRRIDARVLEAAEDLGAPSAAILRRVLLPRLAPALAASFLLLLADAIADLANPLVIGGGFTVLATRLYQAAAAEGDVAAAVGYGIAIWLLSAAALPVARRSTLASRLTPTVAGLSSRPPDAMGRVAITLSWLTATAVLTLFGVIILGAFTGMMESPGAPALPPIRAVLNGPHTLALATTVMLGMVAVPLVVGLGFSLAVGLRNRPRGLAMAGASAHVLAGVPGVVIGLVAFLLITAFGGHGGGGTVSAAVALAVLLSVQVARGLPAVVLTGVDALQGVSPDLRDTAASLGARGWRSVTVLDFPALRPALVAGSLTTLSHAFTSLSTVILLTTSATPLLTVRMLTEIDAGRLASACAMSVVLGVLFAVGAGLIVLINAALQPEGNRR